MKLYKREDVCLINDTGTKAKIYVLLLMQQHIYSAEKRKQKH